MDSGCLTLWVGGMASLLEVLGAVADPRSGNAQRHGLLDILVIALVASVCGAATCVGFTEFGEDREALLREFPSLENGLPRHDRVCRRLRRRGDCRVALNGNPACDRPACGGTRCRPGADPDLLADG